MRHRAPDLLAVVLAALLVLAAIGRQAELAAIAPGDLAAFHQATWSAAHGRGFHQSALSFEGQSLLRSVHFSPVRALWVLPYALWPGLSTLVALQGLAMGVSLLLTARVARAAGASTATATAVVAIVGLSSATMGLATADLRPLVFAVPGVVAIGLGLRRLCLPAVLSGGAWVILCREEAPWLLVALLPLAAIFGWRQRRARAIVALAILIGASVSMLLLVWGQLSVLSTNDAPGAVLDAVLNGRRGLFRDPAEARWGLRALIGVAPALAAPLASLPGLAAWTWLAVFSVYEPALPGQPGAHYLAVVQPFLALGVALGLPWLVSRTRHPRRLLALCVVTGIASGLPELSTTLGFAGRALTGPDAQVRQTLDLLADLRGTEGGVLCEARLAPILAARADLYLRGNFALEPGLAERILPTLDHAVLSVEDPSEPATDAWPALLRHAGFQPVEATDEYALWSRQLMRTSEGGTPPGSPQHASSQ